MKIGFIGCVDSSLLSLKVLCSLKNLGIEVVAVITKQRSAFNSDHVDLSSECEKNSIPFHFEDNKMKDASLKFMESYNPDIIYCFGWSYLLDDQFLNLAPGGVIGFHPAKLPQNRGRHPIIWALALGLHETASTFFKMGKDADTGAILNQVDIEISKKDYASDLYKKILDSMKGQIVDFTLALANNKAEFIEQDHDKTNNWRKRSRKDGLIDWRMRADDIYNLIRSLSKPYPGAEFCYKEQAYIVWCSEVSETEYSENIEPGTVINVYNKNLLIKSGGKSAIQLINVEMDEYPENGSYL